MPGISEEEEKARIARLHAAADQVKKQVEVAKQNPQDLIKLYQDYYNNYLDNQKKSQSILLTALSKIQNTTTELTTREIIELHRNLGIGFNRDGTIAKISEDAPILEQTKKLIKLLLTSPGLYEHYQLLGAQLPSKEELASINQSDTINLLIPIISNILKHRIKIAGKILCVIIIVIIYFFWFFHFYINRNWCIIIVRCIHSIICILTYNSWFFVFVYQFKI